MGLSEDLKWQHDEIAQQIATTKARLVLAQANAAELQSAFDSLMGQISVVERLQARYGERPPARAAGRPADDDAERVRDEE